MRHSALLLATCVALAVGCGSSGTDGDPGPAGERGAPGATGPAGPPGSTGASGPPGATGPAGPEGPAGSNGISGANPDGGAATVLAGLTATNPATSCQAARTAGLTRSGEVYLRINNVTYLSYCEQDVNGGGWILLYNSVLGPNTLDFWVFPRAKRLERFGRPGRDSNYYDGSLYTRTTGATYMDVIEDLKGKEAVALVATATAINENSMIFTNPVKVSGNDAVFNAQFAGGWSSADQDGDAHGPGNCSTDYSSVTQHYSACWTYNLGSDADTPYADGGVGPHVINAALTALGLSPEVGGGNYSRVRRISRYIKF